MDHSDEDIIASMMVTGHRAARLLESRLDTGVSAGEAVLLRVLDRGPATMSEIMATLHIRASTATSLVSRLVDAGYATRGHKPGDRRFRVIALSEAGRDAVALISPTFDEINSALAAASRTSAVHGYRSLVSTLSDIESID
ncbi:MarR family winged helix-turn-helix transcriptional regulator [Microbacterium sp. CPCC 204701]|uniref:MarR family winged helix-turn-helix transcriptional regulator n=1 Tax=Microbacterium sp. CPCC 204701 TaxID=2493084 RepID=UPI000FD7082C|nr:MarR family transcriptional regulator [Microbacterium sp. CPCC 204701]